MKVLVVCSYKKEFPDNVAPFIKEQVDSLRKGGIKCQYFMVTGKGFLGYLNNLSDLKVEIEEYHPDIVHAHFGLCGLLANLQRKVPVVTTYHGSDINEPKVRRLSMIAIRLSAHNIFVSQKLVDIAKPKKHYSVIPCGINLEDYPIVGKLEARREMGLNLNKKYVLFAGAFDTPVKNPQLAKEAVQLLPGVELLELKGYSRQQVALLMNAVDCFLMTSHTEGSPQVIKEAMACGCPIVSVDVGDVAEVIRGVDGCCTAERDPQVIANRIQKVLSEDQRAEGRKRIIELGLSNDIVAKKIIDIYSQVIG